MKIGLQAYVAQMDGPEMIILAERLHGLLQGWRDLGEGALGHALILP